jgi:hypothetical protein
MTCLYKDSLGGPVPNSHHRGTSPLTTFFGSPGLHVENAMVFPHWYGLGDHRLFVLEVSSASLFGRQLPGIGRPRGRLLNCHIQRTREQYNSYLEAMVRCHKMQEKLLHLQKSAHRLSPRVLQAAHDRWDRELGQFMRSVERRCTVRQTSTHLARASTSF